MENFAAHGGQWHHGGWTTPTWAWTAWVEQHLWRPALLPLFTGQLFLFISFNYKTHSVPDLFTVAVCQPKQSRSQRFQENLAHGSQRPRRWHVSARLTQHGPYSLNSAQTAALTDCMGCTLVCFPLFQVIRRSFGEHNWMKMKHVNKWDRRASLCVIPYIHLSLKDSGGGNVRSSSRPLREGEVQLIPFQNRSECLWRHFKIHTKNSCYNIVKIQGSCSVASKAYLDRVKSSPYKTTASCGQ